MPYIGKPQSADAFRVTPSNIDSALKGAVSGSNDSEMTLATASIAAITSSVSRIDSEINTNVTNITLATASIAAITSSISRLDTEAETNETNITLATASIAAITASLGQPVNTDSNVTFNDINSTGTITATEIHTTFVSSSITVASGSNNFGDDASDHHSFTGSLSISGSGTITGSLTVNGDLIVKDNVDFNGDLDVDGTTNLDVVDIDGDTDITATLTVNNEHHYFQNTSGNSNLYIKASNSGNSRLYFADVADNGAAFIDYDHGTDMRIGTEGTTRMTIDTSGKVGIGTSSPQSDLHVSGSSGKILMSDHGQVTLEMQTNDTAAIFQRVLGSTNTSDINGAIFMGGNDAANEAGFHVNYGGGNSGNNYNRRLRLTSTSASFDNCDVGIGTTSPDRLLHLRSADNQLARFESTDAYAEIELKDNGTGANPPVIGVLTDDMYFNTSNAERMRIKSDGKIGINTVNPLQFLSVSTGNAKTNTGTGYAMALQTNESSGQAALQFYIVGGASAAVRKFQLQTVEQGVANSGIIEFQPDGGDVRFPNGILFGSDTAAANELDDYEEGLHSVAITGTTSGAWVLHGDHNQLAYTKIGRKVTVIGKYETSSGSGAGSLKISLPFTPAQLGNSGGVAAGSITVNRVGSGNNITVQLTCIAFENQAFLQVQMHNEDASQSENYLQADDIDGAFEGQIGITYFT